MNDIILKAENISKAFPGVQALDKVRLELKRGKVHALVGENGAGKSTLLKILTGLYTKDSGEIYLEGRRVEIPNVEGARKLGIYVVPQEIQMLENLSIAENIYLGQYPLTKLGIIDWRALYSQANEIKKMLGSSADRLDVRSQVMDLGMGDRQLIEIMRALIDENVKILAFDEPTSSLSDSEAESLFTLIKNLKEKGLAIIYVSHRLDEIFEICDEVSVFKDGKYVGSREIASTTKEELISMMIGRDLNLFGQRKDRATIKDEIVLKVANFSHSKAYKDINIELKRGEILGIYGLVGAGRTEFVRGLFGIDKKQSGDIWINGNKVQINNPREAKKYGIGFVSENRREEGLMLKASLTWNISMPNLSKLRNKLLLLDLKKERKYAAEGMQLFDVKASGQETIAEELSGGNQQKVVLSRWIMADCDILIVDEPTRGIDVGAKHEVYEALKRIASDGSSIIMISSELPEILGVCDRVIVFSEGRKTADLENINLTEEEVIKHAFS
ncbi:MAG: sugar ABC transporter ATP-binding protein, partial [Clostridiales bacterium]|nr:sugar ABC transporter ATP-binding protein [Clostridiales bacterium]